MNAFQKVTGNGRAETELWVWDRSLSVSVQVIDWEHRGLAMLLNQVAEEVRRASPRKVIGPKLEELVECVDMHFKTEERHFDLFNYAEGPEHRKEHAEFLAKVEKAKADYLAGLLELDEKTLRNWVVWFKEHITGSDARYSRLFNENGLD